MTEVVLDQIVGLIILIAAIFYNKYPPRKINSLYGYRTLRSMKNKANWEYSNRLGATYMLWVGVLSVVVGTAITMLIDSEYTGIINVIITCVALIGTIPVIESKLKKFEQKQM